jgi:N-acetylmuramoyl-L-alanine amidase
MSAVYNRKHKIRIIIGAVCVLLGLIILFTAGRTVFRRSVSAFQRSSPIRVIIDAGHGGADGGAVGAGGTIESEINLSIALKTESTLAFLGYNPIMTRRTSEIDYPDRAETLRQKKNSDQKARVELINSTPNAVLISIHQNKYTSPAPSGAQTLFNTNYDSDRLAECLQNALKSAIGLENVREMRQISPDIYLMRSVSCPAALVECGFLSNPTEEAMLNDDRYQTVLAAALAAGFTQYQFGEQYEG